MAYNTPRDLDGFIPHLKKPDTKFRLKIGADLLDFLAEPLNPIVCEDIGLLIDGLIPWMQSSNFKVSSNGIEITTYLIDRLGTDFRPYLQTVLPIVLDRLGDSKDTVREKSQLLITKLLERNAITPQSLIEKLQSGFSHKNARIREEVLRCLVNTLNEYGAQSLTLNRFIPDIVKLLSDPTVAVRDTAFSTLVDLYKHVGEKLRADMHKRDLVPAAKWAILSERFDEARDSGELYFTASKECTDELDRVVMHKPVIPVKKAGLSSAVKARNTPSASTSGLNRIGSIRKAIISSGPAGSLDEEAFSKSFTDVPVIRIFSGREVADHFKVICEIISDSNNAWDKRADALKKIRSLIVAEATAYDEFFIGLKNLDIPMQATIKDLRSQVVREACLTIAYIAQILGNQYEKTAEYLLIPLINLIQNSAKIMSSSGIVTIKFIIRYIQSGRLLSAITTHAATSKSKDIRRHCCDFLNFIITNWPTHCLERHVGAVQEALKKGIADADPEARVLSRKAFRGFRDHFPEQAESLLQALEPSYRRTLQGEGMSASSSNNNLASGVKTPRMYSRPAPAITPQTGSTENLCGGGLQRAPSLPRSYRQRSSIPVLSQENSGRKGFRSNSAIDLQAAQRAKARAQYSALARNKVASGTASLQREVAPQARPRKSPDTTIAQSPERTTARTRNRNSQSQPTSRSGSPSSRQYLFNRSVEHDSPRYRRGSSGIPRSTTGSRDTSRETSPNRSTLGRFRSRNDRPPLSPASRPVMAQKILLQSREAETALADAFNDTTDHFRSSPRKAIRSVGDNHSDESETSSVCSERSFDSYRRASESYSWSGSQQRLASRELWEPCRDINEIIAYCASTTWQERKDGLLSLQYYLSNEGAISSDELKQLTEIFTKMFMDSHTKGLSLFLDTLNEVIKLYKNELYSWIYVLLQRVFLKIGSETLNSVHSKLIATLDTIKQCFPITLLISNVYRFLIDATQTPNTKVKIVVLNFLAMLCNSADGAQFGEMAPTNATLQKIIGFAHEPKSAELRTAARNCIVAMWNYSTPQMTMLLAELPKDYQDIARQVVHSHMRKNSTGSEPASPKPLSPLNHTSGGGDGMNQEEIYRNLRKTTAEIQNYSFETKLDRDRDTTSQDSGISQMSHGGGNDVRIDGITVLEERMDELNIRGGKAAGPRSLPPFSASNGVPETSSNGFNSLGDLKELDLIRNIFANYANDKNDEVTLNEERRILLAQLCQTIKNGHIQHIIPHFNKLLRVLIDYLNKNDKDMQVIVLEILSEIFQNKEMKACWSNLVELLVMRVLHAHCDEKREVVKMAETTAAAMSVFPFNTIVQTLAPLIETSPYPMILGAIKMLTKLIETNPAVVTDEHLKMIMPGLVMGTDNEESPVRKSSIFCMVALYKAVGEDRLSSYITCLAGSKLKLLRLYITRHQSTPVPSSPKNADNSS